MPMRVNPLHFLCTAVLTAALVIGFGTAADTASAAEVRNLKMAFFPSPRHPLWPKLMLPWAKQLEAANVGIKVQGFPGSQIGGSPPGAFKRVVNGISDVEMALPGYTSSVFPRTMVMEIPLQWGSPTEATQAIWRIYEKHLATEYKRVKLLALFATDVPVVMTNKIVRVPGDLKGLKLRTPSVNQAAIIKGLGAIPVAMPITQTYGALEKGVVDGAIVGISVVRSFKLVEVVNNFNIDVPFGYSPIIIVMNKKAYDGLTPEQRAAVDGISGVEYSLKGAKIYEGSRKGGIAAVVKRESTQVTEMTPAQKAAWNPPLRKVVDGWVERFEKQGLPYRQILADYLRKGS